MTFININKFKNNTKNVSELSVNYRYEFQCATVFTIYQTSAAGYWKLQKQYKYIQIRMSI